MTRFKALPGRDYHHTQALPIRPLAISRSDINHVRIRYGFRRPAPIHYMIYWPLGGRGCREVSK